MKRLTDLLKKDAFQWTNEAAATFDALKLALTATPVLALPNFLQKFEIETDALGICVGVMLLQNGHPIAYISKAFCATNRAASAYEHELYAILFTIHKWQHYLWAQPLTIWTNHWSLKHLLDQKLKTPLQHTWPVKLFGFDYDITYKKGAWGNPSTIAL